MYQRSVRVHLDLLFGTTKIEEVIAKNPPITDEEMQGFLDDDGDVTCTIQNFHVDFSRPPSCVFNAEARRIFVDNFLACYEAGHYAEVPIAKSLLSPRILSYVYDTHMDHRRRMYKAHLKPRSKEDVLLYKRRKAANSRQRTVSASSMC